MNTGAQANVLPLSIYNQLNIRPILTETNVKLSAYNRGKHTKTVGQCELNLENKNEIIKSHLLSLIANRRHYLDFKLANNSTSSIEYGQ